MARRRKAHLVETWALSPSVRSFTFRIRDGSPVGHAAGQYLNLIVPTERGLPFRRPYSIASAPDPAQPSVFELAVTRVEDGPTSEALHSLAPGDQVEIEGPEGTFVRSADDRARPALFVATGTGLAPLRAMLAEEMREADGPPLILLFGCRTAEDVLWSDQLRLWERTNARFRLHVTLSRAPPGWASKVGYVQRHVGALVDTLRAEANAPRIYVCGLSAMVDEVVTLLTRDEGVPRDSLRWETYD